MKITDFKEKSEKKRKRTSSEKNERTNGETKKTEVGSLFLFTALKQDYLGGVEDENETKSKGK